MQNQAQDLSSGTTPEILIEQRGNIGLVTLNRPAALNALNLVVLRGIKEALSRWLHDDSVTALVLRGAGDKAFCAGGDLKHFHQGGQAYKRGEAPLDQPVSFFAFEYGLNAALYHYPKPIIAFMHGITMGGGYGLAGNSQIRIACENTVFAMPETKIGFFPDVGAAAHLVKAPSHLGRYLAMTSLTLTGGDVVQAGLADIYVEKTSFDNILSDLSSAPLKNRADIDAVIEKYKASYSVSDVFPALLAGAETHFRFRDAISILRSLEGDKSPSAQALLAELRARAPLSVHVALEHYNRALQDDFDAVISRDYQLCAHFIQGEDLYEGIRALLIDKDKNPRWQHKSLEDVPREEVVRYFTPCVPPLPKLLL